MLDAQHPNVSRVASPRSRDALCSFSHGAGSKIIGAPHLEGQWPRIEIGDGRKWPGALDSWRLAVQLMPEAAPKSI